MTKRRIHIGIEDAEQGFPRFVRAWHKAEQSESGEVEVHLNFEDFSMLTSILTPKRLELLKCLRQQGPLSIRALAKLLQRDYKNVHGDMAVLIEAGLVQKTEKGLFQAPWDVIDAHVRLVA